VHAPSGIAGELAQKAKKVFAKAGPVLGATVTKVATEAITKAVTTETSTFIDKHF
jgi:uncharacterized protein (DUF697 family)